MSTHVWTPGAAGPLDEFVSRLTRMIAAFTQRARARAGRGVHRARGRIAVHARDGERRAGVRVLLVRTAPRRGRRAEEAHRPDRRGPVDRDLGAGSRAVVRVRPDGLVTHLRDGCLRPASSTPRTRAPLSPGTAARSRTGRVRARAASRPPCGLRVAEVARVVDPATRRAAPPSRGGRAMRRGRRACAASRRATRRSGARPAPSAGRGRGRARCADRRSARRRRARPGRPPPASSTSFDAMSSSRTAAAITRSSKSSRGELEAMPRNSTTKSSPDAVVGRAARRSGYLGFPT